MIQWIGLIGGHFQTCKIASKQNPGQHFVCLQFLKVYDQPLYHTSFGTFGQKGTTCPIFLHLSTGLLCWVVMYIGHLCYKIWIFCFDCKSFYLVVDWRICMLMYDLHMHYTLKTHVFEYFNGMPNIIHPARLISIGVESMRDAFKQKWRKKLSHLILGRE